MRRFPNVTNYAPSWSGPFLIYAGLGAAALVTGIIVAQKMTTETKLGVSKKHHAKGVGYSRINQEMDFLRKKTKSFAPHLDQSFYEYSRHNPTRHR